MRTTISTRYLLARLERRRPRPQRAEQRAVDPAALAEGEEVDADLLVLEELRVRLRRHRARRGSRPGRCWRREEVVVDLAARLAVEVLAPKSFEAHQRHVAVGALVLGLCGG